MLRRSRPVGPVVLVGILMVLLSATRGVADSTDAPKVVAAWPAGPLETRVAFDRPIDLSVGKQLVGKVIHFDLQHRALDAWRRQGAPPLSPPLGTLNVAAVRLDSARRTLILTTDPHPREAVYLLDPDPRTKLPSKIAYDLSGVSVSWTPGAEGAEVTWEGWWPDFDPQSSRKMIGNSLDHERGFALLTKAGQMTLESLVRLPEGRVALRVDCSAPVEATLNGENPTSSTKTRAEFVVESTGDLSDLYLTVGTEPAERPFSLRVTYRTEADKSDQPLSGERLTLPWAPPTPPPSGPASTPPPFRLTGGDQARGEALFFGDRAKCSNCHRVNGKGGIVGPDLSDVASRGIEDLYRDIAEPSASIHPDFTAYTVALKDGRVLAGVVRAEGAERIRVTDTDAKTTEVPRSELEDLRPSGTSIMPVGLVGAIGEAETRDILAFLMSASPKNPNSPKP